MLLKFDIAARPSCKTTASRQSLWEVFRAECNSHKVSAGTRSVRKSAYNTIRRYMGTNEDWEGITLDYYDKLVEKLTMDGYHANTISSIVSTLKLIMAKGLRLRCHHNLDFKEFHVHREQPDTVYLNDEEIRKLWNVELERKADKATRDLFLIEVYTAARISDCMTFTTENICGNRFRYIQKKTGNPVIMPLSPKVEFLLRRNGGMAPKINYVTYSKRIREVCRQAGIDTPVPRRRDENGESVAYFEPKYNLVTSHTARRTACTLLYKSGVPIKVCMYLSGHESQETFMRYIRISKEEGADILAANPFFK